RGHPRVLDGRTYWLAAGGLHRGRALNVCVVGSGETAASVGIDLGTRCRGRSAIDVLTARGGLDSRGGGYAADRVYSDPAAWPALGEAHRREFLGRTDRGVFSLQAEAALNQARGFRALAGRAAAIQARDHDVIVTIGYGQERERVAYDAVVVAIGFDGRWFEALLGPAAAARYRAALGGREPERVIGADLSVAGLAPPLHLPVLAGLAQGPGFPNLSCLGLLSDRILRRYVPAGDAAAPAREGSEHACPQRRRLGTRRPRAPPHRPPGRPRGAARRRGRPPRHLAQRPADRIRRTRAAPGPIAPPHVTRPAPRCACRSHGYSHGCW